MKGFNIRWVHLVEVALAIVHTFVRHACTRDALDLLQLLHRLDRHDAIDVDRHRGARLLVRWQLLSRLLVGDHQAFHVSRVDVSAVDGRGLDR